MYTPDDCKKHKASSVLELSCCLIQPFVIYTYIYIYISLYVYTQTVFRISSNKRPRHLLNFETLRWFGNQRAVLIRKRRLFQSWGNEQMNNIKCQNLVISYFKIRKKLSIKIFTINKPNIMKKSKSTIS